MATRVFNLMNGGIRYGQTLKTGASGTYYPGLMVKLDTSGSTVSTAGSASGATAPFGFLFGDRTTIYHPTTRNYSNNEIISLVTGVGIAHMSADLFDEAALPSTPQTTLYCASSGLWTVNVTSNKVGTFLQKLTRFEPVGGVGVSQDLAVVRFSFLP